MVAAASGVKGYFKTVWRGVTTTYVGMRVTWKTLFERPITMMYPEQLPKIPPGHRGLHWFEEDKCIACDLCVKACPVDCIALESIGKGKNAIILQYDIDYQKCLFCNLCCEPCPTDCIHMGPEYDLSAYSREDCIIRFASYKTPDTVEKMKTEVAARDAKDKAAKAEVAKKAAEAKAKAGDQPVAGVAKPAAPAKPVAPSKPADSEEKTPDGKGSE